MPLVYGVPTFDRVGTCPTSPWADLCSLLSDCFYENVLLVVDDRMQLLEEIALFIDTHRNAVPSVAIQKLTALVSAMQNEPHSRILVDAHPTDNSERTAAALADRVIACVSHTLDFEYAFPRSQTETIGDVLLEAGSDLQVAYLPMSPLKLAEHSFSLEHPILESFSSTDACGTPCSSQAHSGSEEGYSPASYPPAASHHSTDVANSVTDFSQTAASDGKQAVKNIDTDRNEPDETPPLAATVLQGSPTQGRGKESASDLVATLTEPSYSRTQEHIPLGEYQASRAVDLARITRAKTSFGTTHDVPALSGTLGRAFWFTNELTILDSILGKILGHVHPGQPLVKQDDSIQRFIDSYVLYARILKAAHPAITNPKLLLRTYFQKVHNGPSRVQISHFEQLVAENTGFTVQCEVRERRGAGKSAHDRYLVVPHCCVELAAGSDAAYARRELGRTDGKVRKITRRTSPEKHFRFLPLVTPSSRDRSSKTSDVELDLQRYAQGPIYVHPSDLSTPVANARRP